MQSHIRALLLSLVAFTTTALAGFSEMGKRLPEDTNAVVAINFDTVMKTPLAQKENWPQRWTSLYEAGPMTVPPGTRRVLSGSRLMPDLENAKWQISQMEVTKPMSMQQIARNENGITEKLWNKEGVRAPSGAYFVSLEPQLIAAITGGDRQFAVGWVRDNRTQGPGSTFIKQAIDGLGANHHVVLALDLRDQYSAEDLRRAIDADPYKATGHAKVDTATLGQLLASIQGLLVQIEVTDAPKAVVDVQFGIDVGVMEFYAKPLMMEILSRSGYSMPEIKDWKVQVAGKRVVLQGELGHNSLRNVVGFVTGPLPAYAEAEAAPASNDPQAVAKASQAYYSTISDILNSYSGGADYAEAAGWLKREAQRIERLSVLNVDPELATWGAAASAQMREAAVMLKGDQTSGIAAAQGIHSSTPGGYYADGNYGDRYYTSTGEAAVARQNTARDRAKAMTDQRAESIRKTSEMFSQLNKERAALRVKLTERYNVAF